MIGLFQAAFRRHELWVLDLIERVPLFGPLVVATLFVWGIPLAGGLVALILLTRSTLPSLAPLFAVAGLAVIAPWLFGWFVIILQLMVGNMDRARSKRRRLIGSAINSDRM